jgi:hypothetical protein
MPYADPERRRQYEKEYAAANREQLREYNKKYYANNREQFAQYKRLNMNATKGPQRAAGLLAAAEKIQGK